MASREENLPIIDESDQRLFEIGRNREQRAELLPKAGPTENKALPRLVDRQNIINL